MLKSQKGFTLIEVLISIAILGIITIGIMNGLTGIMRSVHYTDSREQAKNIAETQIEAVKNQPYNTTAYTKITCPSGYRIDDIIPISVPGNPDRNVQQVTITVRYTNIFSGQEIPYSLTDFKVN
jgi:prepilin-type N-terminal cleavage/methylation domain-containing protein